MGLEIYTLNAQPSKHKMKTCWPQLAVTTTIEITVNERDTRLLI